MRTRRSISTEASCASLREIFWCRTRASAIWSPTRKAGLSEVIGSWKIIASLAPRRSRSRAGDCFSRSSPSSSTSPPAMRPGGCGMRPMIESAVTLLPQPDSPTMPRVRPRSSLRSTPSTARTSPRSEAKCVRRFFTSSRLFVAGNLLLDYGTVEHAPGARLARAAAHEGDEALVRLAVQAAQLGQRVRVVVHAQAQLGILLGRVDEQRRRLLAALVAARRFAGVEGGKQAFGKRLVRAFEGFRGLADHALVGEHVAGHGITLARKRAAPVDALPAGVLADAAGGIDHMELALLAAFVGRGQAPDDFRRGNAVSQQLEALRPVVRVHQGLGRERADAALRVRAERADGEEARRDRHAEGAARGIARDDRPGHGPRS